MIVMGWMSVWAIAVIVRHSMHFSAAMLHMEGMAWGNLMTEQCGTKEDPYYEKCLDFHAPDEP